MNRQPLTTIVTVAYNFEQYIAKAIESVLCQSYTDFELLICDDCSTDRTWELITGYKDPRIQSIRNDKNLGEYPNRNQAIDLARGEYLVYLDGDDIMYPYGLEFMVRMLKAFPEAGVAIARPWSPYFVYPVLLSPRQIYLCEYFGRSVGGSGLERFLFRTSVLRAVGGFDTKYKAGDQYIHHRISMAHSCVLINDNLIWWRKRSGQASQRVIRDRVDWLEGMLYKPSLLRHPECPLTSEEVKAALANLYGGYIRMALQQLLKGRITHTLWLLSQAQIPLTAWKYAAIRGRYDYLSRVADNWPLMSDIRLHPYSNVPPVLRVK